MEEGEIALSVGPFFSPLGCVCSGESLPVEAKRSFLRSHPSWFLRPTAHQLSEVGWPVTPPRDPPVSIPPVPGLQLCTAMPGFGHQNQVHRMCSKHFTTDPFPRTRLPSKSFLSLRHCLFLQPRLASNSAAQEHINLVILLPQPPNHYVQLSGLFVLFCFI